MKLQRFFFHPLTAFVICVLCLLFVLSLQATKKSSQRQFEKYKSQEEIVKQKEAELEKLQAEAEDLDDPFYQEKVLRDDLLLQKEGEQIIQLPTIEKTEVQAEPTPRPATPWREWQALLF